MNMQVGTNKMRETPSYELGILLQCFYGIQSTIRTIKMISTIKNPYP